MQGSYEYLWLCYEVFCLYLSNHLYRDHWSIFSYVTTASVYIFPIIYRDHWSIFGYVTKSFVYIFPIIYTGIIGVSLVMLRNLLFISFQSFIQESLEYL
jgi:hypothetical protein